MLGFKIDNCDCPQNLEFLKNISMYQNQPVELGLECYDPRIFKKDSILLKEFEKNFNHNNIIVHLTLEAKILNIATFAEEEWLNIFKIQKEIVDKINPRYLIIHATSKESKIYSEEEQIDNICENFIKLKELFKRDIFIENTYEDIPFYTKLFKKADKSMGFVCDIGHLKVHSKKSQYEWLTFLKDLNRPLHFHIHDNNGIYDQHKTISELNNKEVISFIKTLQETFNTNFILESHATKFENVLKDFNLLKDNKWISK